MSVENYLAKTMLAMGALFTANTTLAQNAVLSDDSQSSVFTNTLTADPHAAHLYHLLYKRSDAHSKSWIRFSVYDTDSNYIISLHADSIEFAQYTNVGDDYEQGSYTDGERGVRVFMNYATQIVDDNENLSGDEVKNQIVSLLFLRPLNHEETISTGSAAVPITSGPK
ncbi:MAG TPA: hypothetical protein VGF14_02095 [Alphaproteobacteria bacterium]